MSLEILKRIENWCAKLKPTQNTEKNTTLKLNGYDDKLFYSTKEK